MKNKMQTFKIFITHANDVIDELYAVERVVKRFNDLFSEYLNIALETRKWESNSYPTTLCNRPQGDYVKISDRMVR